MDVVPIRIDLDLEGYHYEDTFTWISPTDNSLIETFVDQVCHDFEFPAQVMKAPLMKSIKEQIVDFSSYSASSGKLVLPVELHSLRILIKLDVICDLLWLVDQFEWEPFNARNVAEDFATVYCNELQLSGEFKSAIAHGIREQCFLFLKALLTTGYRIDATNGSIQFNDSELADCVVSAGGSGQKHRLLRTPDLLGSFTPRITQLSEDELEKLMYSRKRENRRKKRSTFSIGSPPKTHRTFLGYRGSLNRYAGSSDYDEDGGSDKRSGASRRATKRGFALTANVPSPSGLPIPCGSCSNPVYPADQGICTKCGYVVSPTDSSKTPTLHADSSRAKPSGGMLRSPTERGGTGTRRGRKPLPIVQISYPVPIPAGPKEDIEPVPEELQALLPEWLPLARKKLDEKYPLDLFSIVFEDKEPKMKCHECSKVYAVGPLQSLTNFETHLKNRTHRANVDWRLEHPEQESDAASQDDS